MFKPETTESQIRGLIDQGLVTVVFSWFEPVELAGSALPQGAVSGTAGQLQHGTKQAMLKSVQSGTFGQAGLATGLSLGGNELLAELPNQIAWFEFAYNQQVFPAIGDVLNYFSASPIVENVVPDISDYCDPSFTPAPTDPFCTGEDQFGRQSMWIDAYNLRNSPQVQAWPYSGRQQVIAVFDSGVWRGHPDMGPLTELGVECTDRTIRVATLAGEPNYEITKPQQFDHFSYGRLYNHGTAIAGLINAKTTVGGYNTPAIAGPSLAPGATILPVRLKSTTKFHGLHSIPDWFVSWGISAPIKAIRALRFNFSHFNDGTPQQGYDVRVVNMSWAYPAKVRNLPWLIWAYQDIDDVKKCISLDLARNDRLYVAAASNEGTNRRVYPASHDNVLGVSAMDYSPSHSPSIWYNCVDQDSSNYYLTANYYEVSGIYICGQRHQPWRKGGDPRAGIGWTASTPVLPGFGGYFPASGWNNLYDDFGGTSAAVPQIAALAYHLYSRRPTASYSEVWNRIVSTRGRTVNGVRQTLDNPVYNMRGPADFQEALNGW